MAIKLFELGFVLKAVDRLSGTLKKIETQAEAVNATAAAPWREFAGNLAKAGRAITAGAIAFPLKDAIEKAGELEDQGLSGFLNLTQAVAESVAAAKLARGTTGDLTGTTLALTTMMLNFGDATKTPIQNATILSDKMAALQTQFKCTNLTDLTYAMKLGAPAANAFGISLDQLVGALATLSAGGLTGETSGEAFMEIVSRLSKAPRKLGFEVFAGPNGQALELLETLQGIQLKFGDISRHKHIAAAFENAFGARARAAFIGPVLAPAIRAIGLGGAALIPQAFEWRVYILKTFAKGIAGRVMRPVHDTSGAKRSEQASLRAAFKVTSLRAAHIAIGNVVTRMRSYLPFSPARVGPLRDLHRVRIVETIAQAFQPAPMFAAIRRVAAVAAVTMPTMIGGAAMPAAGAISSPAGAVVLNYAPHVEVHAPGGDAATLEKAVMEGLEKNRREVYRMLEQAAGRRDRMRFGG